jgi:hypothetical protein
VSVDPLGVPEAYLPGGVCDVQLLAEFLTGHTPFDAAECNASATVTMARRPVQRLLSDPDHPAGWPRTLRELRHNLSLSDAETARLPGRAGCMTKMLTGLPCGAPLLPSAAVGRLVAQLAALSCAPPSRRCTATERLRPLLDRSVEAEAPLLAARVPEALATLRSLRFVGLLERWDESVGLFHATHGGAVTEAERVNTRPGSTSTPGSATLHDEARLDGFRDRADERVYAAAVARFEHELARVGRIPQAASTPT